MPRSMFSPSALSDPVAARLPAIVIGDMSGGATAASLHDPIPAPSNSTAALLTTVLHLYPFMVSFP